MKIHRIIVSQMQTNCYIILTDKGHAIVVDPGDEAEKILSVLKQEHAVLNSIFLTHGHFDHIGAVNALQQSAHSQMLTYVHPADQIMLNDAQKNFAAAIGLQSFPSCKADATFEDEDICVDELKFQIIHTPGHSKGSCCILVDDVLFSGDTLFCEGIGRCDGFGGSLDEMLQSLKKLAALKGDLRILSGHGEETTLSYEKSHNPYLIAAMKG